jgi:hypothetical protein
MRQSACNVQRYLSAHVRTLARNARRSSSSRKIEQPFTPRQVTWK